MNPRLRTLSQRRRRSGQAAHKMVDFSLETACLERKALLNFASHLDQLMIDCTLEFIEEMSCENLGLRREEMFYLMSDQGRPAASLVSGTEPVRLSRLLHEDATRTRISGSDAASVQNLGDNVINLFQVDAAASSTADAPFALALALVDYGITEIMKTLNSFMPSEEARYAPDCTPLLRNIVISELLYGCDSDAADNAVQELDRLKKFDLDLLFELLVSGNRVCATELLSLLLACDLDAAETALSDPHELRVALQAVVGPEQGAFIAHQISCFITPLNRMISEGLPIEPWMRSELTEFYVPAEAAQAG